MVIVSTEFGSKQSHETWPWWSLFQTWTGTRPSEIRTGTQTQYFWFSVNYFLMFFCNLKTKYKYISTYALYFKRNSASGCQDWMFFIKVLVHKVNSEDLRFWLQGWELKYHSVPKCCLQYFVWLQVKEDPKRASRISLDIEAGSPVCIAPISSKSKDVLVVNLGNLTLKNEFLMAGSEGTIARLPSKVVSPLRTI